MAPAELMNARVRPLLAAGFGGALVLGFLVEVAVAAFRGDPIGLKDLFAGGFGVVVGWFFGKRDAERQQATEGAERQGPPTPGPGAGP